MGFWPSETRTTQVAPAGIDNTVKGQEDGQDLIILPVKSRKIRDVPFLIIYSAFLISLLGLIVYSAIKGDVDRITHGVDKYGNVCGKQNRAITGAPSSGKDLRHQPYAEATDLDGGQIYIKCTNNCSEASMPLLNRCIPKRVAQLASSVGELVSTATSSDFLLESTEDIGLCWREIIYLCLIALGVSLVITILLRFLAGFVIWISIALVVVASLAGTAFVWYCWYDAKRAVEHTEDYYGATYKTSVTKWLGYAIASTFGTVILLLLLFVMRNRIRLVIALFEEAGRALTCMPLLLLQPVWTFLWLAIICSLWIYALLWIESSGTPAVHSGGLVSYTKDEVITVARWYHVFALLWITQFCLACQDYVIGGAVSEWYFTRDKSTVTSPITTSIVRLLRYHLGSIALGSLIITIIKVFRMILKYIEKKLIQHSSGTCTQCISCCLQCMLYCFENFVKFLSRNAYVEIGIFGVSFCEGAKRAFRIITNNALKVAAINSVGDFVLLISKLGVVLVVIFTGIELIKSKIGVHHIWVPILLCALFALLISHCFLSVYEMSIDTLLVCFCEDCDLNDGVTRPYFMSSSLMKFVKDTRKELALLSAAQKKVQPAPPTNSTTKPDTVNLTQVI